MTDDAVHRLEPPSEIREAAARVGFPEAFLEARGHEQLEVCVSQAYGEFVQPGSFYFRPRADVGRIGDVLKFRWEMVSTPMVTCQR